MQGIKVDLTGQRFGKLLVLGLAPKRNRGYQLWYVQCDCGSPIKSVITTNLTTKRGTKSCGCLGRKLPGQAARNKVLRDYKFNAKKRGLTWRITDTDFDLLAKTDCHYCGCIPSKVAYPEDSSNGSFTYNGIDRKDNTIGYEIGNCVSCCKRCNWAKGEQTYIEFMEWLETLSQYHLQKQTFNLLIREQAVSASA